MKIPKLVTKEELVDLLKNNKTDSNLVGQYQESILVGREEFKLNCLITLNGKNIETISLNYYCKSCYKFLFPYTVEDNVFTAINKLTKHLKDFVEEVV